MNCEYKMFLSLVSRETKNMKMKSLTEINDDWQCLTKYLT